MSTFLCDCGYKFRNFTALTDVTQMHPCVTSETCYEMATVSAYEVGATEVWLNDWETYRNTEEIRLPY